MLWYICWKHEHRLKIQLRTLFVAVKHVLQLLSLNLWEIPKTTQFKADILSQCTVQCVLKTLRKKLDKRRSVGLKERCNWEEILRYDNYTRTGLRMGLLETRIQIMDRHGWRWSGESLHPSVKHCGLLFSQCCWRSLWNLIVMENSTIHRAGTAEQCLHLHF